MTQTRHRLDPEDVPPFLQVADPLWRPLSASASRTHGQLALGVEITRDPQDQTSQLEQEPNRPLTQLQDGYFVGLRSTEHLVPWLGRRLVREPSNESRGLQPDRNNRCAGGGRDAEQGVEALMSCDVSELIHERNPG